ncbi:hypothetical protein BQ8482_90335 [Mesorhizobium delmotii]|uniref:Uncharacterized protein n=1 Tax=Mesorhizobium delmotii TaxID=1631247 RepID=A0A2P9AXR4_9HYPH|nr:hypothetical protein BQ8482_90335 [Mesorhizobium delmotii]
MPFAPSRRPNADPISSLVARLTEVKTIILYIINKRELSLIYNKQTSVFAACFLPKADGSATHDAV